MNLNQKMFSKSYILIQFLKLLLITPIFSHDPTVTTTIFELHVNPLKCTSISLRLRAFIKNQENVSCWRKCFWLVQALLSNYVPVEKFQSIIINLYHPRFKAVKHASPKAWWVEELCDLKSFHVVSSENFYLLLRDFPNDLNVLFKFFHCW